MTRGLLARLLIVVAMLALVVIGASGGPPQYSDIVTFNDDVGDTAPAALDPVFKARGAAGIEDYFDSHPIPLNSIDTATGREVIGWSVEVGGKTVAGEGVGNGDARDERRISRSFGAIVLRYERLSPR